MKTIDEYKRPVYPEKELTALIECKKRMDFKIFKSSYFSMVNSRWNYIRNFLLQKGIIKKQHTSYIWTGQEPDIKLAHEFVKFYKSNNKHEKKIVVKKNIEKDSNQMYEDLLSLRKQVQELKIQNREMYKELKSVFQEKIECEKNYEDLKDVLKKMYITKYL